MKKYLIPEEVINRFFTILDAVGVFIPSLSKDMQELKNKIKSYEFKG